MKMSPDEQSLLWKKLESFQVDSHPVALSFTRRLARENGWNVSFAERVFLEYKRFAFLACVSGHPCTPSDQVDQAWHLHLTYTRSYWDDFCRITLPMPLHHEPTEGGSEENAKFEDWYERTLESYRSHFGEPAADIWPPASQRFGADVMQSRVNLQKNWVIRKPTAATWAVLTLLPILVIAGCAATSRSAADRSIYIFLFIVAIFIVVIVGIIYFDKRKRGDGGCVAAGFGGFGDTSDGGSGCSSGGGGCGGGGCSS